MAYIQTKDKYDEPIFGVGGGGAYICKGNDFNLQSVKLITFLPFLQYKACILVYFMSCKM